MVDLELSSRSLAFRLVLAAAASAVAFLVFYLMPTRFIALVSGYIPADVLETAGKVLSNLINPVLPTLGLLLTLLVFLSVMLGGSRLHGPVVILEGVCLIAYISLAFQGGTISITVPKELLQGLSVNLQLNLTTLLFLFLIAPLLTVVKGVVLALKVEEQG